jgi:hypothetical protein
MTLQDDFNSSIVGKMRKGTWDDPHKKITETLPIINGKATLSEIPSRSEKVSVTGNISTLYEIEDGELSEILYRVDYENGVVFFNVTHNNKNFTFTYEGIGRHFFPSDGIWVTQDTNGSIQTAKEKFDRVDLDIAAQKSRVDVHINSVPQPNEILDIRVDRNGVIYDVAKQRIDAEQKKIEDAYVSKKGTTFNSLKERLDKNDDDMGDVGVLVTKAKTVVNGINEVNVNAQTYANTAQTNAINFAKQYGVGSQLSSYKITGNLNSSTTSGLYYVDSTATNKPETGAGYLIVIAKDNSYVSQMFIDDKSGVISMRTLYSSWGVWKKIQLSTITDSNGGVKLSVSDVTKDFLQEILNLGVGMHTFYAIGGTVNTPSAYSVRGIFHYTNTGFGWIYATDSNNNAYTNYYNNSAWRGWQQLINSSSVVTGSGERIEVIELNFSGGSNVMSSSGNFSKAFAVPPTVIPAYVSQSVSYMDTMSFPFLYNITTTGFSCLLKPSNTANNFGPGTGKMKFFVYGK